MRNDTPLFEVVVPTSDAAERRLVTAAMVRTLIGSPEADDAVLELLIDGVSAECARFCKLARAGAVPATFGRERVRATWQSLDLSSYPGPCNRTPRLVLPWRAPITEIEIAEDGVDLVQGTDFRLLGGGIVERLGSGNFAGWSGGVIVADYTVGWLLGVDASAYDGVTEPVPADLAARVIDQVKMHYLGRTLNPALRSESTEGVGSASYNVVGGDAIGTSGLLKSLESALAPFRSMVMA